ncbi:MAG TPA: PilZ domain-containing protein [Candidatus Sulfotelmatobacter sp.]|nr:PilZ domain-containing protein [Candidatus Sulfotelmatobacter sp.]
MTLSALLVCADEDSSRLLQRVLAELSIAVETCPDFVRAGIRLAQQRFDLVVLEGKSTRQVISLLRETRQSRKNDATLAVVVLDGQDSVHEIFSLGANFIFYKPLSFEQALNSMRAVRVVMRRDKRKKARAAVHAQATVDYANIEQEKATLIDLAENGMSVQFGKKLPPVDKVYFQFKLPGQTANIRLSGQIMWQDWKGRAGIQFADVPKASRRLLSDYLDDKLADQSARASLADVTVEVEETLLPGPVAVAEITHRDHATPSAVQVEIADVSEKNAEEAAKGSLADPDNRRTQSRHACRLGAVVYRKGITVPHRCNLTDLSSGGCYLEFPLPFTTGASVEIVVRTYEMKLSLRGKVLTSHPGYGMGVGFELNTAEELSKVNKLLNFVSSTMEPTN